MNDFFRILRFPKTFFSRDVKKITGFKRPASYFVILSIIFVFASTYQEFYHSAKIMSPLFSFFGMPYEAVVFPSHFFLVLYVVTLFSFLISASFRYYITYLFTKLFNKKAHFQTVYKVMSFSTTHGWLGTSFFVVFTGLLLLWLKVWWWWILLVITGLGFLALELYSVYLRSFALAHAQKITWWQAFVVIYLLGQSAFLLVSLFVTALVSFVVLAVVNNVLSLS